MMKDISTPVPAEEFRKEMRSCLHQAALVNYTRVSAFAKIEGDSQNILKLFATGDGSDTKKKRFNEQNNGCARGF